MSKQKLVPEQRTIDIVGVLVMNSDTSDTSDEFRLILKIDE
jgi:hypothetical protein